MNLRGERVEMKLKPTVSAYAPFYISSANYGFFAHGTWPGTNKCGGCDVAFPRLRCEEAGCTGAVPFDTHW